MSWYEMDADRAVSIKQQATARGGFTAWQVMMSVLPFCVVGAFFFFLNQLPL